MVVFTEFDAICPHCGCKQEVHSSFEADFSPAPGDISVCWRCVQISEYDFDLSLRLLSDEKQAEVMSSPELQKALFMVRRAKAQSVAEHN